MQSKTSLFSGPLFRKNLSRYAPLWGIFLGVLFLNGPMSLLQSRGLYELGTWYSSEVYAVGIENLLQVFLAGQRVNTVLTNALYALLCAALLFRYLHRRSSAYMMHSLPLNRSTQFCTNLLSALSFSVIPYGLQALLNLLVCVGIPNAGQLLLLTAYQILTFLCFFGLALFCMMLSGRTVIAVLSYIALNLIGWVLPAMVVATLDLMSFGLKLSTDSFTFLSPIIYLCQQDFLGLAVNGVSAGRFQMFAAVLYALCGLALVVISWLHYRARQIENAGEAMAYTWARLAFLLVFTVCCTLGLGLILGVIFSLGTLDGRNLSVYTAIPCFLIGATVGYFAAQMMLKRTVRVFQGKHWAQLGIFAAVTVALLLCVRFDVLGLQRPIPQPAQIDAVILTEDAESGPFGELLAEVRIDKPEDIEAICAVNAEALAAWDAGKSGYSNGLSLRYELKDGRSIYRRFDLPKTAAQKLLALLDDPEYAVDYYDALLPERFTGPISLYSHDDWAYSHGDWAYCRATGQLRDAILADAAEGNLPINSRIAEAGTEYYYIELQDGPRYLVIDIPSTAKHTLELFLFD